LKKEMVYQTAKPFDPKRAADIIDADTGETIGIVGEFKAGVRRALKLPATSAGFEISTAALLKSGSDSVNYKPLPRFPRVTQDITLKVPAALSYQELAEFLAAEIDKAAAANSLHSLSPVDIYQSENDAEHKNVTFRLSIASYERTLTDAEVNKLFDEAAAAANTKFKAERI
jgi:phenylalanyl-tRNA synthetase beta chain